jgi:hypothetical protein
VGIGLLLFLMNRSSSPAIPVQVAVTAADTAGFQGTCSRDGSDDHGVRRLPVPRLPVVRDGGVPLREGAPHPDREGAFHLPGLPPRPAAPVGPARCPFRGLRQRQNKFWEQHRQSTGPREWSPSGDPRGLPDWRQGRLDLAAYDDCALVAGRSGQPDEGVGSA